ncbi:MAG: hypothetical protein ACAI25_15170 [Planctomycetota bacterium]
MQRTTISMTLLLVAALLGCGGGGGGGGRGGSRSIGSTASTTSSSTSTPSSVSSAGTTRFPGGVGTTLPGSTTPGSTTPVTPPTTTPVVPPVVAPSVPLSLTVTSPSRGDQLAVGATLVKGKALGAKLVTVNGQPATTGAAGDFAHSVNLVEGANIIEVKAVDAAGKAETFSLGVIAGTFLGPTALVNDAATARITNQALAAAAPAVNAILMQKLQAIKGLQVGDYSVNVLGRTIKTTVDVSDITIKAANVLVQSQTNGLHAALGGQGFDADLNVNVDAGSFFGAHLGFKHTLDLHFDKVAAEGLLGISATNGVLAVNTGGLKLDYSPTVIASIIGQGNLNAINSLLGGIGNIFGANLKIDEVAIVNGFLTKTFNNGLKATADATLAKMIAGPGTTGLPVTVGSYNASVFYKLESFKTDTTGFTLSSDLDVRLNTADKHASKGSLVTTGAMPALTGATGVKVAVNQDMLNRVFETAWRKGELDIDYKKTFGTGGGITTAASLLSKLTFTPKDLALLIPALQAFIPAGSAFEITAMPKAPPVILMSPGGKATLQVTDLQVSVSIKIGTLALDLLTINTSAQAPVTFSVVGTTTRSLKLDVGTAKFAFDLEKSVIPLPKTTVETALQFIVPVAVKFGAQLVGPIPLPSVGIAGLKPTVDTLTTDGSKGTFLRADISIK